MRQLLLLPLLVLGEWALCQSLPEKTKEKTEQKVIQRTDQKIDQSIDKGLNKMEEAINGMFKKKSKKSKEEPGEEDGLDDSGSAKSPSSKSPAQASDFVPGVEVLFSDDFSQDALGDFPAQWNTNGSGQVVEVEGQRWLEVIHNSIVNPVMDQALPENATVQFDLLLLEDGSTPFVQFGLTNVRDILREDVNYGNKFFVNIHGFAGNDTKTLEYGLKADVLGNKSDFPLTQYVNEVLHVDIAINKTRVRIYFDGQKLIDLPRALSPDLLNNIFFNNNYVIPASETPLYLGNVRIASAETDARSLLIKQLMEEGTASTSEILFAVNSDIIETSSFPILDQIGQALLSNPGMNLKITGHTDSDGDDSSNLALSINRANSVKTYLITKKGIEAGRLTIDGKGETMPVAPNTSAEGKAKNRRVQFTKN
ncbi:outer membrane protein OmpA-like peptidoglycan-associated protein [Algoriphagus iocasae]|uniref:Outer membrane protein OmpA-like peptidoglycan-associated protein n=1 Tax=Algoriphagus iocasae TaxID=1836499 RepID=A0A841MMV9_9BACT|nr:OmpA family protein [Algoriphagus iocasae]MBB6328243.1 outer membrane protein OmpA-like peptidoglycan-associated protein [Algoriphagus iocasae]